MFEKNINLKNTAIETVKQISLPIEKSNPKGISESSALPYGLVWIKQKLLNQKRKKRKNKKTSKTLVLSCDYTPLYLGIGCNCNVYSDKLHS